MTLDATNPDPWLTSSEAACRARLGLEYFRRVVRLGKGPVKTGAKRLMRFRASDVDAWVAAGFKNI